jgi:hypothetical protein
MAEHGGNIRNIDPAMALLENVVREQGKQIADLGATVENILSIIDDTIIPNQKRIEDQQKDQDELNKQFMAEHKEAHDFVISQQGAWAFIVRFFTVTGGIGAIIAAVILVIRASSGKW